MKKNKFIPFITSVILFVFQFSDTYSQSPPWSMAIAVSDTSDEVILATVTDADGNIYNTGYFNTPSITFGTETLVNNVTENMFLVKYDAAGNVIWARTATGSGAFAGGTHLAIDANGDVILGGYFYPWGPISFGSISFNSSINPGSEEIFVAKYDTSGNVIWAKRGGGSGHEYIDGLTVDALGNVLISVSCFSDSIMFGAVTVVNTAWMTNFDGMFVIAKYDQNGVIQWAEAPGGGNASLANDLRTDQNGNIFVAGSFQYSISLDGITLNGGNGFHFFLVKYDASGNALWARIGSGNLIAYNDIGSMAVDANGNVYLTGFFAADSLTFDGNTVVNATPGTNDMFLAKYDGIGNILFLICGGGAWDEAGSSLLLNDNGDVYLGGTFKSPTVNFGGGPLNNSGTAQTSDIFITKYDSVGQPIWSTSAGGGANEMVSAIANSKPGEIIVSGSFESGTFNLGSLSLTNAGWKDSYCARLGTCQVSFTLQPDTLPLHWIALYQSSGTAPFTYSWNWGDGSTSTGATATHTYAASGYYNICLTLTDATGCSATYCDASTYINRNTSAVITITAVNASTTGIADEIGLDELIVYPQPANEGIYVDLGHSVSKIELVLADLTGRIISSKYFNNTQNIFLETNDISSGSYMLTLKNAETLSTRKIIVSH